MNRRLAVGLTARHLAMLLLLMALSGCVALPPAPAPPTAPTPRPVPTTTGVATPIVRPSATPLPDRWVEILQWTPYPYTTPLPAQRSTAIDGTYVRIDPRQDERPPCRRCPPYPPSGGAWKVMFDEGIFWVFSDRTGWRTLGSYTVDDGQIVLFNDPWCKDAVGRYTWKLVEGDLVMRLLSDDCETGTRGKNFTGQPWQSCQPPGREASISGHWKTPDGC